MSTRKTPSSPPALAAAPTPSPYDDHPLLTARHVDNLVDAMRSLDRTLTRANEENRRAIDYQQRMAKQTLTTLEQVAAFAKQIAENTAHLPALLEVLVAKKTNGDLHDAEEREGP